MGISVYKIKKWAKMLAGNSVYHVNQGEGQIYSNAEIKGYYNDLTEKITRFGASDNEVPKTFVDTGEEIYFSIAIFQYGLAAYDLYLLNNDRGMLEKTIACADWAVENQEKNGGWITFAFENADAPYSSMAQGEAISLLIRAHIETQKDEYLNAARKAKEFMLTSIADGGTTNYADGAVAFYEYTADDLILNGWIFSLWGLYDYCRYLQDADAQKILDDSLASLRKKLPEFDNGYWSKYDNKKRICSLFYHKLHIAQLRAMYRLFGDDVYREYADKWEAYAKSWFKPKRAFFKKAWQKIVE